MKILAIETSCDETGIALVEGVKNGEAISFASLKASLLSQAMLHAPYGGVYPNLAKREHQKNLPVLFEEFTNEEYDAVAVTRGPGLEPALWTGITFAEALAKESGKPLYPVNHMEGHLISSLIQNGTLEHIALPVLGLLISGGHTEFVLMKEWFEYEIVGETLDDAVGEAFDKVARMLELPYPGGPHISKLANEHRKEKQESEGLRSATGARTEQFSSKKIAYPENPGFSVRLPRPMINENSCDVSFSGLKTAVLYALRGKNLSEDDKKRVAREFEDAVADVLVSKSRRALKETGAKTFVLGGGVAANAHLRQVIGEAMQREFPEVTFLLPDPSITGDNAIMIAEAALARALNGQISPATSPITAKGHLSLSETN